MRSATHLGEAVISTIEQYAPNIRKCIVGMQVISPKDIEAIAGITGGNIFHGELLLHQIFFLRPAPQWADFRTPLKGYYFGASGAHPGGGVMGAAGMLAAKEILKDWSRLNEIVDAAFTRIEGQCSDGYRTMPSSSARVTTGWSPRPILPRPGKKVLVLERRAIVGGSVVTESFGDGFQGGFRLDRRDAAPRYRQGSQTRAFRLRLTRRSPAYSFPAWRRADWRRCYSHPVTPIPPRPPSRSSASPKRTRPGWPEFVAFMNKVGGISWIAVYCHHHAAPAEELQPSAKALAWSKWVLTCA